MVVWRILYHKDECILGLLECKITAPGTRSVRTEIDYRSERHYLAPSMQRSYTYVGYIDSSYSIQATRFHTVCKSIV